MISDYTTPFTRSSQQELHTSGLDHTRHLKSDLAVISKWVRKNLVSYKGSNQLILKILIKDFLDMTVWKVQTTIQISAIVKMSPYLPTFCPIHPLPLSKWISEIYFLLQFLVQSCASHARKVILWSLALDWFSSISSIICWIFFFFEEP